ncbi:MAG: hypothetical protein EXQ74_07015, partial [Thermoleophilia bacterium]|nr:hypothetical protein [Thermoleophilia bacterium]
MRRSIRVYLGCLLALVLGAQGLVAAPLPGVSWATQAGGSDTDVARGVSALPDGSSLVTGYFNGT